jgi:putative ABC transport system substrate-binding protein
MNRRDTVLALLAIGAAPLALRAQQQGKVWRVGFLSPIGRSDRLIRERFGAIVDGLRELGYVEGKNLAIEYRFADGKFESLPGLAAELIAAKVDVIVTAGTTSVTGARKATKTIPIVAGSFGDPVGNGFAASLAHPGGNITGMSTMGAEMYTKRLEMLMTVAPKVTRVGLLVNPDNAFFSRMLSVLQTAAKNIRKEIFLVNAHDVKDIESGFSMLARQHAEALMIGDDIFLNAQGARIAEFALRNRLPSIFPVVKSAEAGGLMSYGINVQAQYRGAATYIDKIFKGAKPGDLPIQRPSTFELVINLKTAKALGIKIPQSLLIRADRVIE